MSYHDNFQLIRFSNEIFDRTGFDIVTDDSVKIPQHLTDAELLDVFCYYGHSPSEYFN